MRSVATVFFALTSLASATSLDGRAVVITNTSEPVLCAEKDNVTLNMASSQVKSFTIEALHPSYIGMLQHDRDAPDWTACPDIQRHAETQPAPKRVTLYEGPDWQLVGHSFADFWRPAPVIVRVGNRAEPNIHLVQLWKRVGDRLEEVLVVYPQDGYWRAHPLPPEHLKQTSYGSSFLIGPVEFDARPVVKVKDLAFDPATVSFRVEFMDGNRASLALSHLDKDAIRLKVDFALAVSGRPFAALRSMYVTETNADAARVALREKDAKGWSEHHIMRFEKAEATDLWAGRLTPSRHNTSAPDMVFGNFR